VRRSAITAQSGEVLLDDMLCRYRH